MCGTCGIFRTMHRGVSAPWCCAFIHRVAFEEVSGIGFLSRAGREIGVFRHVAPPTRLRLEFPRETGLILRRAGKSGNPFQTKQGNRPSCRHQEGRRGSAEAVLGTSMFSSSETGALLVVPSSNGMHSKKCTGIGFLLIADQEMGSFRMWHHHEATSPISS